MKYRVDESDEGEEGQQSETNKDGEIDDGHGDKHGRAYGFRFDTGLDQDRGVGRGHDREGHHDEEHEECDHSLQFDGKSVFDECHIDEFTPLEGHTSAKENQVDEEQSC